ncbi:MAG: hypothetical protein LBK54_10775 [Propionibacteriaceae bacterium]|nr:hypothetical protein [Propionibacteriaceae bacterium]
MNKLSSAIMKRTNILIMILALMLGSVCGALAMALFHGPVDHSPITNATRDIMITAQVESRPVRDPCVVSGQVLNPAQTAVMPRGEFGTGVDVITAGAHAVGDLIGYGSLVAEISGVPVVAFPSSVPLYRDLAVGMTGADVTALQQALIDMGRTSAAPTGRLGVSTMGTLVALYTSLGYQLPKMGDSHYLPMSWTVGLSGVPALVTSAGAVGQMIDPDNPIVIVEIGEAVVIARVDMLQSSILKVGATVDVEVVDGPHFSGTVTLVSDYQEGVQGMPPGYDITVPVPSDATSPAVSGAPATITDTETVAQAPAVPLTAIRRDGTSMYVWLLDTLVEVTPGGGGTSAIPQILNHAHRVDVSLIGQASGYAILNDDQELVVGSTVVVSGM